MDWARDYFERCYAQRWSLGPPSAETQRDADALWARLRLVPGATLLDIGCGHGRHAVVLAQRGAAVTGLDFASHLLRKARELAEAFAVTASWVQGDMRHLPFRTGSFQATISFDAFGFFEQEEENQSVLRELARVLVPGGRAALKLANGQWLLANFRADEREVRGDTTVEIQRNLLHDPPRLVETLDVTGPRGNGCYRRRQRVYRLEECTAAMEAAGLAVLDVTAVMGTSFESSTSSTMVILAERRAR